MDLTTNPFKVEIADATETEIEISATLKELMEHPQTKLFIVVVSGTAQFSVGQAIQGDAPTYAANESLWITVTADMTLRVKFAAGGVLKISF